MLLWLFLGLKFNFVVFFKIIIVNYRINSRSYINWKLFVYGFIYVLFGLIKGVNLYVVMLNFVKIIYIYI